MVRHPLLKDVIACMWQDDAVRDLFAEMGLSQCNDKGCFTLADKVLARVNTVLALHLVFVHHRGVVEVPGESEQRLRIHRQVMRLSHRIARVMWLPCLKSMCGFFLDQTFDLGVVNNDLAGLGSTYLDDALQSSSIGRLVLKLCSALGSEHAVYLPWFDYSAWIRVRQSPRSIVLAPNTERSGLEMTSVGSNAELPVTAVITTVPKSHRKRAHDPFQQSANSTEAQQPKQLPEIKRSRGLRLPIDLQVVILSYVAPRSIACVESTCYVWRHLVQRTVVLRQALRCSRAVGKAYASFFVDDWGERSLSLWSWVDSTAFIQPPAPPRVDALILLFPPENRRAARQKVNAAYRLMFTIQGSTLAHDAPYPEDSIPSP